MSSLYKVCRTEQSAQRQRQLEQVLLEMMLKQRYEDISVSDLCHNMQIPRKSFYRYFDSKDGALYALIDHTMGDFFQYPVVGNQEKNTGLVDLERFFLFWYERRQLLDALQRSNLSGILVDRVNNFAVQEGHLPRQFKNLRPEQQGPAMAFTVCGLMAMLLSWHGQGFQSSPREMASLSVEMMTKPLLMR